MPYFKAIFFSLVFHSLLFYSMAGKNGGNSNIKNQSAENQQTKIKVISKQPEEKIKQKKKVAQNKGKVKIKVKRKEKIAEKKIDCDKYYEGIGVQTDHNTCVISDVFKGYAAEKAGLQIGDLIISPSCTQIRGPSGSIIQMKIMRGSNVLNLSILREKVCEERSKP